MIYKDKYAINDASDYPYPRPSEKCINCGQVASAHDGWACKFQKIFHYFNEIPANERYLTASMANSIAPAWAAPGAAGGPQIPAMPVIMPPEAKKSSVKDMSDWRNWAHNRPGECKCGIPRNRCDYHKEELRT